MVTDKPILMSQQNGMDYITQELFLCFRIFSFKFSVPYSRGRISIFLLFVPLLASKFCLQDEEVTTVPLSPPALGPSFLITFAYSTCGRVLLSDVLWWELKQACSSLRFMVKDQYPICLTAWLQVSCCI